MTHFKTLDTRGLSFVNALDLAGRAFSDIRQNGILELILDKQKDFTVAFKNWAASQGHKASDVDEDSRLIRLFIKKGGRKKSG